MRENPSGKYICVIIVRGKPRNLCMNCPCEKKMPKMRKSGRVTKKRKKLFIYFLNRTEK